jgi:hypothetical protein
VRNGCARLVVDQVGGRKKMDTVMKGWCDERVQFVAALENRAVESRSAGWPQWVSVAEAEAYLQHPVLGPRLVQCAEAAVGVEGRSASEVFGSPDDMKLR